MPSLDIVAHRANATGDHKGRPHHLLPTFLAKYLSLARKRFLPLRFIQSHLLLHLQQTRPTDRPSVMAPDGRMYQASRKGELFELKQGLNATTTKERKSSLKRTVAAMTLGKDVSSLFTDVVKNTAGDLSMKKLVYLYIIKYAQAKPDLAILIVNTFIKDAVDPNPLIRALAIRTMALIPLEKITEYLCDPLHAALKDQDPYVRKTAAVSVAKLYDTDPTVTVEEGFIGELQELLGDGNPMVVSNSVAALSEIAEASNTPSLLDLSSASVPRFLSAMSECTEWGQIFILDALSSYVPADAEEADLMVERIIPRLQHANAAVVLAAIRIIVSLMPRLDSEEKRTFLYKKMAAPLITLLTSQPELQFVTLRNMSLLVAEYPELLSADVRVFFASYADPFYVKTEKLNILVRLTNTKNSESVLSELMEYAGDVDVAFAQKAISSIASIALCVSAVAGKCVSHLSELLKRQVPHITEQVATVLKDILREYPDRFLEIVLQICGMSNTIDDPAAKSALVWIIGEYAAHLPMTAEILEVITNSIDDEAIPVQLQILTACVKTFMAVGPEAEKVCMEALHYATHESENVDVRDRGFIYQRLISAGSDAVQQIVLSNKIGVEDKAGKLPNELQKELLRHLSSVAAVYHKPAKEFTCSRRRSPITHPVDDMMGEEDLLGLDEAADETSQSPALPAMADSNTGSPKQVGESLLDDILGGGTSLVTTEQNVSNTESDFLSSLGIKSSYMSQAPSNSGMPSQRKVLLPAEKGNGLFITGELKRGATGAIELDLEFQNCSPLPMEAFAIQFNKNMFGLVPTAALHVPSPLGPSSTCRTQVPLQPGGDADASKGFSLQIAVKYSPGGVVYFAEDVSSHIAVVLDRQGGLLSKPDYLSAWKSVPDSSEVRGTVTFPSEALSSVGWISSRLASNGIFTVAKRMSAKPPVLYLSGVTVGPSKLILLAELTLPANKGGNVGSIASRLATSIEGSMSVLVGFNETFTRLLGKPS